MTVDEPWVCKSDRDAQDLEKRQAAEPKLTEAQQQAQDALDKVMNCRFSNFDAGAVIHWAERGMYQVKT